MRSRYYWVLLGTALAVVGAHGQDKGEKSVPSSKPDLNAVEVRFADDSTVKMVLQHNSVEVVTRYGKLNVPVGDIRRIEFGLRIPEDTAKRIEAAIAGLGSSSFKQRDTATAELLGLRELAYPALQQAARSTDPEVSRRAKDTIKLLAETVLAEKLHLPHHDTVVALDFTIIGRIEAAVLKARTPYFGETSLKLAEVRTMRWLANENETKVAVDAGRYGGAQETWMDTGIEIRSGGGLQIAAAGTVDLRPAAGDAGTYLVGPDGQQSMRMPRGGGGGLGGGLAPAGRVGGRGFGSTQTPGTLLGRIGEYGKVFIVGSRFDGAATDDGKLYLRIVPSSSSPESSGSYEVRVTSGR